MFAIVGLSRRTLGQSSRRYWQASQQQPRPPRLLFAKSWPDAFPVRTRSRLGSTRRRTEYRYFESAQSLWYASPEFRYGVFGLTGLAGALFIGGLEKVPVTGRTRFNVVSSEQEQALSKKMYRQAMQQYRSRLVPRDHPASVVVRRVLKRLIPASGLEDSNWELHVVNDPKEMNAFVIPGGKVFVFSGILPVCGGEDGLAAMLGHEIAHNVAHHAAERTSQMFILIGAMYILSYLFGVPDALSNLLLQYGFVRPGSRKQEAEADYMGLMMMAQSCYDPSAAIGLWERLQKTETYNPPQWMSTHPSSRTRIENIRQWLPEAEKKRADSDCHSTLQYAIEFRKAMPQVVW